ncbi:MAG TPA: hypothetical protein VFG69_08530 [Nannocystaceae bacterium]|nr:hypothetical protein [Nannocystaceae bacterium]
MRTWSHGITVGIGLGLALAGACKDDGGNGPVGQADAPSEVAARFCAAYFECACEDFTQRFDSMGDCQTEIAEQVQDDIDDGNGAMLTYQADCPGIWIDAVDTVACQTLVEASLDSGSVAAVAALAQCKLFFGERTAGQSCDALPDVSGDDCQVDLVCVNGTCAVREDLDEGEACMPDGTPACGDGLFCYDVDGNGDSACERLPVAGETCLGMLDLCDLDLYCDQANKTCVALPGVGEACGPMGTLRCGQGAVCGTDEMCEAAPGAGEPCTLFCDVGLNCEEGICAVASPLVCGGFAGND